MHRKYVVLFAVLFLALLLPTPAAADSFVVNTTDDADDSTCDSNHCSLREAINAANNNNGPDKISFSALNATGGDVTIPLFVSLPPLLDNATTIDGTTIQGYSGSPELIIFAYTEGIEEALHLQSNDNAVVALSFTGFGGWANYP